MFELHHNLGFTNKTILDAYEGNKPIKFELIRKICDNYAIPTKLFFEEKNMNIKDYEMAKPKKLQPVTEKELDTAEVKQCIPEVQEKPEIKPEESDDYLKKLENMIVDHTYKLNKSFFIQCRELVFNLREMDRKEEEIKKEIFNLICKKMLDKTKKYDIKTINPKYTKILDILIA